jgi:hypothetical protein
LRAILLCSALLLATTCGSSNRSAPCPQGAERCACFGNSTCNTGLTCLSNLCVNTGGAGGAGDTSGSGGLAGTTGIAGSGGTSAGGDASGAGGIAGGGAGTDGGGVGGQPAGGAVGGTLSGGFSCTIQCTGPILVFMGARPPQGPDSDIICWTPGTAPDVPVGDQLWTYDSVSRVLLNQLSQLALKRRSDGSFGLGTSAADGTPLTARLNVDGTYTFVFDDGDLLGLTANGCMGALYSSVAPGTAGYQMAFALHQP